MAQLDVLNDITIGNDDPALFAIGKKWIEYAQSECDTNDIATAIWSAISEVQKAQKSKAAPQSSAIKIVDPAAFELQPIGSVTRYGKRADGQPWHGLNVRENGEVDLADGTALYAPVTRGIHS